MASKFFSLFKPAAKAGADKPPAAQPSASGAPLSEQPSGAPPGERASGAPLTEQPSGPSPSEQPSGAPLSDPLSHQIQQARALHQQGQLEAADTRYRRILQAHPDSAETHYRHANVLKDQGKLEASLLGYDRAIALQPDYSQAFCNRAVVLGLMGNFPEALSSYDRAIALEPKDVIAYCNRGVLLNGLGQKDAALASFDGAIAHDPGCFPAHFGRAALLQERREFVASLESYDRAIAINAADPLGHYNRGTVLRELGQWDAALASYDRAIALDGEFFLAHTGRANALWKLERYSASLDSYDRAIALNARDATTYNNRGVVLQRMGRLDAALSSYGQAIAADSDYAEAHFNRGTALEELGLVNEAIASYRQSVVINPDYPEGRVSLAAASLKAGDFGCGWTNYEWRWRATTGAVFKERRDFWQPLWTGKENIEGKTLLLYGEQGLGDSLQFCRYAGMLAERGARVVLEVPLPLVNLCGTLKGVAQVIPHANPLPDFDFQCPLMSLPLAFETTLDTVPSTTPYLSTDARDIAAWNTRLASKMKPRVGLTWSGRQTAGTNRKRHFPLASLIPHLPPEMQYFCLQTDVNETDRKTLAENPQILEFRDELRDFSKTAALCECMDLVISVDTSIAHLSGALGKTTWVLLAFNADWRWLIGRDDSPWYPTMRLYRQKVPGGWNEVFERVAADLRRELP
jgi:tetratricopeptide (TPR) repeat protein